MKVKKMNREERFVCADVGGVYRMDMDKCEEK